MPVSLPQLNVRISIHALREEGDPDASLILGRVIAISIHALREEGDRGSVKLSLLVCLFLSTPSARRATHRPAGGNRQLSDFYPRPPRGGRHWRNSTKRPACLFLSTPSARRATWTCWLLPKQPAISIHALREEGDLTSWATKRRTHIFLSTPSARRATSPPGSVCQAYRYFYPRPPRGGRRSCPRRAFRHRPISIHALREEGDLARPRQGPSEGDFYPRPPRGGRRFFFTHKPHRCIFLSTPSARRATTNSRRSAGWQSNFYPRPPRGGRRSQSVLLPMTTIFLSTPSARRATQPSRSSRAAGGFLSTPSARRAT